ncbi:uncharacterized protein LOC119007888 isoform X3 [Acanthopagrus latus]|uniref:uncharacterized protein LOC119007888 isoform X3 n=1 Tax=Acanthopagrus latus TaxID=8177 RepID=UPI00187C4288|nr:uncharacterized protein LOC119007888 isoform X3 [Acanthopagrus latus]
MVKQASSAPAEEHFQSDPSEPDRSRQRVTEKCQRQEISSTSSTEQQPFKTQSEQDQQQEDHLSSPEENNNNIYPVEDLFVTFSNDMDIDSIKNISNYQIKYWFESTSLNVNTDNTPLTERFIQQFIEKIEELPKNCGKSKLNFAAVLKKKKKQYLNIKKINNAVGARWPSQSFIDKCNDKIQKKENIKQYTVAIVFKDDDAQISPLIVPDILTVNNCDCIIKYKLHSEEILIRVLHHYLQNNGNNVQHVFIYTHYSPCKLRKEECREPCMLLLQRTADQWYNEYGFGTEVVYDVSWVVTPKYFNDVNYSHISHEEVIPFFKSIIEDSDNIPFELYTQFFNELKPEKFVNKDIQSELQKLKALPTSVRLKNEHLEEGYKIIANLENIQDQDNRIKCDTLKKKFEDIVNKSSIVPIREILYKDFNTTVDYLIANDLQEDDSSHLKLHHILDRNPGHPG